MMDDYNMFLCFWEYSSRKGESNDTKKRRLCMNRVSKTRKDIKSTRVILWGSSNRREKKGVLVKYAQLVNMHQEINPFLDVYYMSINGF
jgi:hypothetical protein